MDEQELSVIFEEDIKVDEQPKEEPQDVLNPNSAFLFEIGYDTFSAKTFLPENSNPKTVALFLQKLTKGHLNKMIIESILSFGKETASTKAEECVTEWLSLIAKKKPMVSALQALPNAST